MPEYHREGGRLAHGELTMAAGVRLVRGREIAERVDVHAQPGQPRAVLWPAWFRWFLAVITIALIVIGVSGSSGPGSRRPLGSALVCQQPHSMALSRLAYLIGGGCTLRSIRVDSGPAGAS